VTKPDLRLSKGSSNGGSTVKAEARPARMNEFQSR
jgi:hypothetical protein